METVPDKKGMKKVIYKEESIDENNAYIKYKYVDHMYGISVNMHMVTVLLPKKWLLLDDTWTYRVAGQELTRYWGELFPENLQFRQTQRSFSFEEDAKNFIKTTIYEIDFVNKNVEQQIEIYIE